MKRKALAIVLTLLMLVSVLPMGAFAASYTDTEGHWAEKSIDRWTEAKVLEGMGNNTFAPDEFLTRAQAMTVFSRLLNLTEKADISSLTDVAADAWYAPYIETGYAYQIIKGTSDTTFDPSGNITREQFFSVFARAVGIPPASTCDKTFTDLDQVSSWFVEEGTVYSMINRGYLNGYPDGSLKPQQYITRAEVAKVLDNAISDYITEDGTYPISGDGIVVVLAKNVKLTGNFNGHIVSSCPDSTLDTSGVNGTPYIYVLGDNTKIINAKPGTKVAVNPAADNVTANGVKVTYNPYVPSNPYIVPSVGGGGSHTAKQPNAVLTAKMNNRGFRLVAAVNNGDSTSKVLKALADQSDEVKDAVNAAFGEVTVKDTPVGAYTVSVEPAVKDAEGNVTTPPVATVTGLSGSESVKGSMDDLGDEYMEAMKKAATDAGFVEGDGVYEAWIALAEVFNPADLFDCTTDKMQFLYAQDYADKVAAALKNLAAFIDVATDAQVTAIYDEVSASGWSFVSNFFKDLRLDDSNACDLLKDKATVNASSGTILSASKTMNADTDFVDAYADFCGIMISDPVLKALITAGFTREEIQGDYQLSISVSEPQ